MNFLLPLCFYRLARWLDFLTIESISWNTGSSFSEVLNFKSKCYLVWPKKEKKKQLLKMVSISWCVHIAVTALGDLREQLAQHFKCRNASVSAEAQKQLASTQSSCASGASFFRVKGPILQFLTAKNHSVINVQIRRETVALMELFSS